MGRLAAKIIFFVLTVFLVTNCFNQVMYAYSLSTKNLIEWDDNPAIIWENEPETLCNYDVAQVEWSLANSKVANLKITNAYPGYQAIITTNISNISNMPVKLEGASIELPDGNSDLIKINFNASDGLALNQRVLEQNETVEVKLSVELANHVEQNQNILFRIVINAIQATEGPGQNGNNGNGNNDPGNNQNGGNTSGQSGSHSSGNPPRNYVDKDQESEVKSESPDEIILFEKDLPPEGVPELLESSPDLPIQYNELPYTGGTPYLLAGALLSWVGIGVLLRKKIF